MSRPTILNYSISVQYPSNLVLGFMLLLEKLEKKGSVLQKYINYRGRLHHLELKGKVSNRMIFDNKEYIIWCLNDYLGLMHHPESIEAAAQATTQYGPSYPHSVRLTIGHSSAHDYLEQQLNTLMGYEDSMLVNLGYQGFMSIIDALTDRHDTIIYDQKCHACLIDGVRLHNGRKFAFKHNDINHLETQLQRARKTHNSKEGMIIVVVDGLYSMHGELAKLDEIVRLKKLYNFALFVDDSHAFGVFGKHGKGSPEHYGIEKEVDVYVSTFTKSFGNLGGFVSAKKPIIDFLRFATRSQIFSRSMPLPMVLSVSKNIEIFQREPERRERLWKNTNQFQEGLREMAINIGPSESPIVPIHINGNHQEGLKVFFDLREMGIFSYIVAYPVVEKNTCLIRMVCTHNHTTIDIEQTLHAFKELKRRYPRILSIPKQNEVFREY